MDALKSVQPKNAKAAALSLVAPITRDRKIITIASQRLLGARQVDTRPVCNHCLDMMHCQFANFRRQHKGYAACALSANLVGDDALDDRDFDLEMLRLSFLSDDTNM